MLVIIIIITHRNHCHHKLSSPSPLLLLWGYHPPSQVKHSGPSYGFGQSLSGPAASPDNNHNNVDEDDDGDNDDGDDNDDDDDDQCDADVPVCYAELWLRPRLGERNQVSVSASWSVPSSLCASPGLLKINNVHRIRLFSRFFSSNCFLLTLDGYISPLI